MTRWIDLKVFEEICFEIVAQIKWRDGEPIPPFYTREQGKLEACLAAPQQTFGGELLYPTLIDQAAILFYLLNKNHAFINGNKRIALTTLLVFLFLNQKWLSAHSLDLYKFAVKVARSRARSKDRVVREITNFITANLIDAKLKSLIESGR